MFRKLANQDSWFFKYGSLFFDLIVASLLFVLTSLPVITLGPSFTALYGVVAKDILPSRGNILRDYFRFFKENFLQAMFYMLFFMFFVAGGLLVSHAIEVSGGEVTLFVWVARVLFIPFALAFPYGLSLMIHFRNTFAGMLKNAYIFAYAHAAVSFALLALLALIVLVLMILPSLIVILPGAYCAVVSLPVEKYMKPHLPVERDD